MPVTEDTKTNDNLGGFTNYKQKYSSMKSKLKAILYENELFQEELRKLQRELLDIYRDKEILLERVIQYEDIGSSSSDSESQISDIACETESIRIETQTAPPTVNTKQKPTSVSKRRNANRSNVIAAKKSNNGKIRTPTPLDSCTPIGVTTSKTTVNKPKAPSRNRSKAGTKSNNRPQPASSGVASVNLPTSTNNIQPTTVNNIQPITATIIQPTIANNIQTTIANNIQPTIANNIQTTIASSIQTTIANNGQQATVINGHQATVNNGHQTAVINGQQTSHEDQGQQQQLLAEHQCFVAAGPPLQEIGTADPNQLADYNLIKNDLLNTFRYEPAKATASSPLSTGSTPPIPYTMQPNQGSSKQHQLPNGGFSVPRYFQQSNTLPESMKQTTGAYQQHVRLSNLFNRLNSSRQHNPNLNSQTFEPQTSELQHQQQFASPMAQNSSIKDNQGAIIEYVALTDQALSNVIAKQQQNNNQAYEISNQHEQPQIYMNPEHQQNQQDNSNNNGASFQYDYTLSSAHPGSSSQQQTDQSSISQTPPTYMISTNPQAHQQQLSFTWSPSVVTEHQQQQQQNSTFSTTQQLTTEQLSAEELEKHLESRRMEQAELELLPVWDSIVPSEILSTDSAIKFMAED